MGTPSGGRAVPSGFDLSGMPTFSSQNPIAGLPGGPSFTTSAPRTLSEPTCYDDASTSKLWQGSHKFAEQLGSAATTKWRCAGDYSSPPVALKLAVKI